MKSKIAVELTTKMADRLPVIYHGAVKVEDFLVETFTGVRQWKHSYGKDWRRPERYVVHTVTIQYRYVVVDKRSKKGSIIV